MKRLRPHQTIKGRVIYDRKVHPFTEKDLVRVFRSVVDRDEQEGYIDWLVDLLLLLFKIAIETLYRLYAETLPRVISEFVIKLLSGMISLFEKVGVAAYTFLQAALQKAFGLLVIKEADNLMEEREEEEDAGKEE